MEDSIGASARSSWKKILDDRFLTLSFVVLVTRMAGSALAYAMTVLIARTLPIDEFGIYSWFFAFAFATNQVATLGQVNATLRYVPQYYHLGQSNLIRGMLCWSLATAMLGGLTAFLLTAVLAPSAIGTSKSSLALIVAGGTPVFLLTLCEVQSGFLRAVDRPILAAFREIEWRLFVIVMLGALAIAGKHVSLEGVLLFCLGAIFLSLLVRMPAVYHSSFAKGHELTLDIRRWSFSSSLFWAGNSLTVLLRNADVMFVGINFTPGEAGMYFAATRLASVISLFTNASSIIGAAEISKHYARSEMDAIGSIARKSTGLIFLLSATAGLMILAAAPLLLSMFGKNFVGGQTILGFLIAAQIIDGFFGMSSTVLGSIGQERAILIGAIIGCLAYSVTGYVFVGTMGPIGFAVAQLISVFASKLFLHLSVKRILNLDMSIVGIISMIASRKKLYGI